MMIRDFRKTDIDALNVWLDKHGEPTVGMIDVPNSAYVAVDGDYPVAVAFLRLVEGGYGIIDGLCTNPNSSSVFRNDAIDSLVSRIITECQCLGLRKLMAYSVDAGVLLRSKKHGFSSLNHVMISKDIGGV